MVEELPLVDAHHFGVGLDRARAGTRERGHRPRLDAHLAVRDDVVVGSTRVSMVGLKIWTRWRAIWARRRRRISSSLLPLNMQPTMTSIQPCVGCRTTSMGHDLGAQVQAGRVAPVAPGPTRGKGTRRCPC